MALPKVSSIRANQSLNSKPARFVSVPFTPDKIEASKELVRAAQVLEATILTLLVERNRIYDPCAAYPAPNREQALALTKLEEAVMWANRAIAVSDLGEPPCVPAAFTYKFEATGAPATQAARETDVPCDHYFPSSGAGTQCTRCRSFHPCDPRNLLAVAEQLGAGEYANYNDKVAYKLVVTPRS